MIVRKEYNWGRFFARFERYFLPELKKNSFPELRAFFLIGAYLSSQKLTTGILPHLLRRKKIHAMGLYNCLSLKKVRDFSFLCRVARKAFFFFFFLTVL